MAIFFSFSLTSNHLHPLQVENWDSNSRLVVDKNDNGKFRLERVNNSSNCETGMGGMVTCRPTVAYGVQGVGINIGNYTDYKILLKRDIEPMLF